MRRLIGGYWQRGVLRMGCNVAGINANAPERNNLSGARAFRFFSAGLNWPIGQK